MPELFAPGRPRVITIGGIDLYARGYISDLGALSESRTFQKDKLIDNDISIEVDNADGYFSANNPRSPYYGQQWRFSPFKIWNSEGILIWDGILWDIIRNCETRKATLVSRSSLSRIKNIKVSYTSSDWETGAAALLNIFETYGITEYDQKSFVDSAEILSNAGAYIKAYINTTDNLSLQGVVEKIAEYCCADVYAHLGIIYFKVWKYNVRPDRINIGEADILGGPTVQEAMSEIYNDYSIGYDGDGGTPATDSANGNIGELSRARYDTHALPELWTNENNQIIFKDLATAVWVGEQYIRRTHRNLMTAPLPLLKSEFMVDGRLQQYIDLETSLALTFRDEAFAGYALEVFGISRNYDRNTIDITAYGIAS